MTGPTTVNFKCKEEKDLYTIMKFLLDIQIPIYLTTYGLYCNIIPCIFVSCSNDLQLTCIETVMFYQDPCHHTEYHVTCTGSRMPANSNLPVKTQKIYINCFLNILMFT